MNEVIFLICQRLHAHCHRSTLKLIAAQDRSDALKLSLEPTRQIIFEWSQVFWEVCMWVHRRRTE